MAKKNKTTTTDANVTDFINSYVDKEQKRQDSFDLVKLFTKWSGCEPKMFGPTIIGFGNYHYKYASGHEGDAPLLGFSPRKAAFTLYVIMPGQEDEKLLQQLGKFKMSKGCIYLNKLADIKLEILEKICKESLKYMRKNYVCSE